MPLYQLSQPKLKKPLPQQVGPRIGVMAAGGERSGVVQVPADVTFYAPLDINTQDYAAKAQQTFTRASGATVNRGRQLRAVNDNASRHESAGLLMEPASTNKSANYNANPDDALTNIVPAGPGTVSAIDDAEKLREAGLSNVCTDGRVFAVDARGVGTTFCYVDGDVGNTNVHTISAYCRAIQGTGFIGLSDGISGIPIPGSQTEYGRLITTQTPDAANRRFLVSANSDSLIYFVLNQLEEQPVATSLIANDEAAASNRDADQLQWPLTGSPPVLNQTEGVAAVIWYPGFSTADIGGSGNRTQRILALGASGADALFLYYQLDATGSVEVFSTTDGTNFRNVTVGGLIKHQAYVICIRWEGGNWQVGYKTAGAWTWGSLGPYDGNFENEGVLLLTPMAGQINLPNHARRLYFWGQGRATSWLESFFADEAN